MKAINLYFAISALMSKVLCLSERIKHGEILYLVFDQQFPANDKGSISDFFQIMKNPSMGAGDNMLHCKNLTGHNLRIVNSEYEYFSFPPYSEMEIPCSYKKTVMVATFDPVVPLDQEMFERIESLAREQEYK
ncbi:hypothetical protein PGT21_005035 [Puccinia graminis f. sp. tritici]|uniref:Uncharacterized protein n=2 Tax=Puccinia graminis f. sp. tritici TaxID=56615 RepID=E3JTQ7_PUCGT|nr:uncharacterized protein PGTG_00789 [Puccinia graminis f. sp. tritici CRL 75-36-700-3]EFP75458.1 hypothetical protein PGTG_00789 [Puccinia graminis f. sp. tritici CRL 75-36-700-3]KAA1116216.1 hypothetical protein PGT21_005035 [Puccinia graminis f. sp. tritici]KAA1130400.1 hypothetical protein PGTUg99_011462 [Puccinia graminis f. sp. tritici]